MAWRIRAQPSRSFEARILTFATPSEVPQAPEDLGFEAEEFKWGSQKERQEELSDLQLPMADGEEDNVDGVEIPELPGLQLAGRDLDDQQVRFEVGVAVPAQIQVNGVVLTADSPLRSLRAACASTE